jgi:hypothetical protein
MAWLAERLGHRPRHAPTWREAVETARAIHAHGWRAYRPVAALLDRYVEIPVVAVSPSLGTRTNTK